MANVYTGTSDACHDDYERGRPGWPPEVFGVVDLPPESAVLELGAGTGKLTPMLVERFARVVAVEPDEGMRRVLAQNCRDVDVRAASAEEVPLDDGSVDAVSQRRRSTGSTRSAHPARSRACHGAAARSC